MSKQNESVVKAPLLSHVCEALGKIAPLELAQSWDNVGLLAGDVRRPAARALLCVDLTSEVAAEAIAGHFDIVVAYHPPIFKPVTRLTAQGRGPEAAVFACVSSGIAVYSPHTALDAAEGGTNDTIAALCGIAETAPLEYVYDTAGEACKLVTFVPPEHLDAVADAMFAAGAGRIGDYSKCSYRLNGHGTFLGGEATHPAVGRAGAFERVDETRMEMVCPVKKVPAVVAALIAAHPYEEPAYDIYPVKTGPVRGIGRLGRLPKPISPVNLAKKLKRAVHADCVQIVGAGDREVSRAVIVVGAAGSLPFSAGLTNDDVIVTGEIRHHDALAILRSGCGAIALNHWTSERPVLKAVAERLMSMLPGLSAQLSESDREPFHTV
jgi:dinuclear metal center YbgI/SA1388 family protein